MPRPLRAWELHTTPATTIALIDELLDDHPYDEAVQILNERGLTGGWGKPFNVPSLTRTVQAPRHPRSPPAAASRRHADRGRDGNAVRRHQSRRSRSGSAEGSITGRRVDGRREFLYHPDQARPPDERSTRWQRNRGVVTTGRDDIDQAEGTIPTASSIGGAV